MIGRDRHDGLLQIVERMGETSVGQLITRAPAVRDGHHQAAVPQAGQVIRQPGA